MVVTVNQCCPTFFPLRHTYKKKIGFISCVVSVQVHGENVEKLTQVNEIFKKHVFFTFMIFLRSTQVNKLIIS